MIVYTPKIRKCKNSGIENHLYFNINNLVLLSIFFCSNIYIFPFQKRNYHFTVLKFAFLSLSYSKCISMLINIVLLNPF